MHVAILSPIAWRTPPRSYGPWEYVASLLTEGLIEKGIKVTLFATKNSITKANLISVCPRGYEEDSELVPKVWECLHISELFERGDDFDIIHNHFDFLPLTYVKMTSTPVLTTIHGISSPKILPVFKKYNNQSYYVSISNAARIPDLKYIATVYHGVDLSQFTFNSKPGDYLLFFGRIHHDKGTKEAIKIALKVGMKLILAGIIQDKNYFKRNVDPFLDNDLINYVGVAGPKKRDELLGGAYALLNPINIPEAFGLSVVEAMACGTPVISFNKGSMSEVILNGKTGFLVDSIEEAIKVLKKIDIIDRAECRRWVEKKFTVERMVDNYIKVYESILAKDKN
ncbi:MAG: glycosyltransferase family 4 protein [Candidatus Lokiarchaeota archaeon]|nr:glycosyltransferase family 4 protein [Candidatus Lokiarchaeota archaeon]